MGLLEEATGRYGYVTVDDARAAGVDPAQLRIMNHRGLVEHVARGVYRFPIVPTTALDQYMEAVLWPRTTAVLSHETALDLHGLCDVNPARIHITVPTDYRVRRDVPRVYQLHRRDLDPADVTLHEGIPIVTVYWAIRDGIEAHLGRHLIDQAIETARRGGLLAPAELRALSRQLGVRRKQQPARSVEPASDAKR
ncbi:MAG: type IV toxin-antitoxin system AbiEi family antitoxin domain-containing protein [Actinomycetota bacterium]